MMLYFACYGRPGVRGRHGRSAARSRNTTAWLRRRQCRPAAAATRQRLVTLSRDEVKHIAQLARVGVTDEDVTRFQAQLSVILDHFQALREIDTSGVPPTAHTLPLANVERDDAPRPSYPTESVLANAPRQQDAF